MPILLLAVAQLSLITVVYLVAYRTGYKAAHARAAAIVKEFSGPLTELIDRLNNTAARSTEAATERKAE